MRIRIEHFLTAIALAATGVLASCGGGGAPQNLPPAYPPAVTELTEADLDAADVPALPSDNGASAARGTSADFNADGVVDAADYVALHNLTSTTSGFVTNVPADTTSRVIAWVLYRLPGNPGDRTRSLNFGADLLFPASLRIFAAVSNFSAGRWEPAGRIADGTSNTLLLSTGPRYNRVNGDSFVLLMVAHPGHGEMSGHNIQLTEILISSINAPSAAEDFEAGLAGSVRWSPGHVDFSGPELAGTQHIRQQFLAPIPAQQMVVFPQPLNLSSADGHDWFRFQNIVSDWNGDATDTVGFYDPSEVNGQRHAYRLGVWDDTDIVHAVSIVPVQPQGSDSVLIGLLIPAVQVMQISISVDPTSDTPERSTTTNAKGEFTLANIDELEPGVYYISLNFEEIKVTYKAELVEEEGIFYFIMSDTPAV